MTSHDFSEESSPLTDPAMSLDSCDVSTSVELISIQSEMQKLSNETEVSLLMVFILHF